MSMASLEKAVVAELREVTGNKKLTIKNVMEWSTGEVKARGDEVYVYLPKLAIHVAYLEKK